MFRPFLGPVFQKVLDRLHQFHVSTGRQVLVAYSCPLEQPLLEQHPGFVKRDEYQVVTLEYSWNLWECVGSAKSSAEWGQANRIDRKGTFPPCFSKEGMKVMSIPSEVY